MVKPIPWQLSLRRTTREILAGLKSKAPRATKVTMPLISYEGVEVDIPATLSGIQFAFANGALTIQCNGFSGNIVLSKPVVAAKTLSPPMTLSDFPSMPANPVVASPGIPSSGSVSSLVVSASKKRSIVDEPSDLDTEESDGEALHKRIRPNFLNDVEQTMLLAQLEASQPSQRDTIEEVDSLVSSTASPERSSSAEDAPVDFKTPAKPSSATKSKKPTPKKSFFSPDPKEPAAKKSTPESSGKRGRPSKSKSDSSSTQISIRDMMLQVTPNKPPVIRSAAASWSLVDVKGTPPVERWGHTATRISENRVVVYGGADDDESTLGDLFVYDLNKNEWSRPLNCESIPRTWHDSVYLESKRLMLVFGGERNMGGDQMDVLSDIMVLDTDCFLWYPPAISGVAPIARSGHTCTVVGNDIVVFGGSRGRSRQSSVHVLDSENWNWKTVKIEGKPPTARTYHSGVAVGDSIVYFGGNDSKKSFNSVHVLKKSTTAPDTWTWFHPCVVGAPPCARTGHSATLVDNSKILIFGGWDPQSGANSMATRVFDDGFLLHTETWEWEPVQVEAKQTGSDKNPAIGRVGHCAVMADDHTVLLLGGQDTREQRLGLVHALTFSPSKDESGSASTVAP
ncbi:hypothetical protein Poli38472_012216 [Pythium oligandrum]|uniref:Uncharacterized protein n=1 Tax=Pythium oligandrum TaxID=41045 RepID=A0A8K1CQY2_PYTOL|nr:hypothetical protein Poli38472_012216 [Pythium oligandrum]|eukprot:TMW67100.1 hypothetical protein Poli38472_012216 [Pythium oligandrum]